MATNRYPYTNYHELNLSWIINKVKELDAKELTSEQVQVIVAQYFNDHRAELKGPKGDPGDTYTITEEDYAAIADVVLQMLSVATSSADGLMSSTDKKTLDNDDDVFIAENLIPFPYTQSNGTVSNGVTFTVNDDGSISANGTATADAFFDVKSRTDLIGLTGSVTYTVSGVTGGSSTTYDMYMSFRDSSNAKSRNDVILYSNSLSFSFPDNTAKIGITIRIRSGNSVNNVVFKPMLETGSVYHKYQPYRLSRKSLRDDIDTLLNMPTAEDEEV